MDAGEDATKAAVRELLEETGFSGKVVGVSPILSCDPGMTNANMRYVIGERGRMEGWGWVGSGWDGLGWFALLGLVGDGLGYGSGRIWVGGWVGRGLILAGWGWLAAAHG